VFSSPVIANGILYIGSMDMNFYALNAESGRFRMQLGTLEISGSPAVSGSTVYFTSRSYLYAIDGTARNCRLRMISVPGGCNSMHSGWRHASAPLRSLMGMRIAYTSSNTTPVIDGDKLFTTGDNKVYRLDLPTKSSIGPLIH